MMPERIRESDLGLPSDGLSIYTGSGMLSAYDDKPCWLSFTQLMDEQGRSCLYIAIGKPDDKVRAVIDTPSFKSIMMERDFFSERHFEFINAAIDKLPGHRLLKLSDSQKNEFDKIVKKIESIGSCDYRFKKEYLQQLIFLLVHFSVKNFSASAELRSSSLT